MDRRINGRGTVRFSVTEESGRISTAVNISSSGILLEREGVPRLPQDHIVTLDLHLPHWPDPLRVQAKPVWSAGTFQAFKFVGIPDADRLDVAETLDRLRRLAETI